MFKTNFLKTLFLCFAIFETRNACVIIYVSEFHQGTKLENGQVEKHCLIKEVADDLVDFRMFRSLNKCG